MAIKSLHAKADAAARTELLKEAAVMAQFANCQYITGLVGVVTKDDPMLMLIHFAEHGALNSYLQKHDVDEDKKMVFAGDCAEGLA